MVPTSGENFCLPATVAAQPTSPPTWWPSVSSTSGQNVKGKEVRDGEKFNPCSFQEFKTSDGDDYDDEKMDVLWEDLNEESWRSCGKTVKSCDVPSPVREVRAHELGYKVRALKLTKPNDYVFCRKRPGVLVFIKLLKKVFIMQNSKKRAW